jgi:hypothetical protein
MDKYPMSSNRPAMERWCYSRQLSLYWWRMVVLSSSIVSLLIIELLLVRQQLQSILGRAGVVAVHSWHSGRRAYAPILCGSLIQPGATHLLISMILYNTYFWKIRTASLIWYIYVFNRHKLVTQLKQKNTTERFNFHNLFDIHLNIK